MNTEEKAKSYDEVREKIALRFGSNVAEEIFSEFEMSEDEKIRRNIIAALKGEGYYDCDLTNECIAWLEKQCYTKKDVDDAYLKGICYTKHELEKQGEQESADKHEPKFNVGDWITNGDYTWKVIKVEQFDYILQSQNGNIVDDTISHVDEQFHSFTIKDAKDGNILVYNNGVVEIILLFKEWKNGCIGAANAYVHMFNNKININNWCDCSYTAHPATKEQCDILFQKMKESGYEWDDEKKELKKIEKKSQRMVSAEAKEALYDKPAWSEEDMKEALRTEYEKGRADTIAEMKKDWSEEDEKMLDAIIDFFENGTVKLQHDLSLYASWLKSLRPQKQWRPSDEQMEAFEHFVRSIGESGYASPYDNNTKLLYSLLNDLKKLIE